MSGMSGGINTKLLRGIGGVFLLSVLGVGVLLFVGIFPVMEEKQGVREEIVALERALAEAEQLKPVYEEVQAVRKQLRGLLEETPLVTAVGLGELPRQEELLAERLLGKEADLREFRVRLGTGGNPRGQSAEVELRIHCAAGSMGGVLGVMDEWTHWRQWKHFAVEPAGGGQWQLSGTLEVVVK